MSVTVGQIAELCGRIAPCADAEEWDNVGLLAGSADSLVDTVLCALDLTEAVVDEAVVKGAQMIVTHHPILFRGRKNLREDDAEGRMLCKLVRANLAMFAMHTNYDNAKPGVNDALAEALGLLEVVDIDRALRQGRTEITTFEVFADFAERALGGPIRRYGDPNKSVKRVSVLGGSGGDYLPMAMDCGTDVFVTGEVSYHRAMDAVDNGMCVLEAGHAATERPGILALSAALQKALDDVQYNVRVIDSEVRLCL